MSDEQKPLKREDELTDISEIPAVQKGLYAPQKTSLFGKVKEGASGLTHKITDRVSHMKDTLHPHHEEITTTTTTSAPTTTTDATPTEAHNTLFAKLNEGLSGLAHGISNVLHLGGQQPVVEKAEKVGEQVAEQVKEAGEQVKEFGGKLSQGLENYKDSGDLTTETTITPNREGPSVLDKIDDEVRKVTDKITDTVEAAKEKVLPASFTDKQESERVEDSDSNLTQGEQRETLSKTIEAPTHQINPADLKDFHEVKEGFKETVDEFKHEHRVQELGGQEQLVSSNPFGAFEKEVEDEGEEEEEQVEESSTRTIGGDISNKVKEQTTEPESKSLAKAVKEGITESVTNLGSALGQLTDKGIATLQTPVDKENFRQIA